MNRQNPAVKSNTGHCFNSIVLALEADVLQGATAQRVIQSAKSLLQGSGTDAQKALSSYSPETQERLRGILA